MNTWSDTAADYTSAWDMECEDYVEGNVEDIDVAMLAPADTGLATVYAAVNTHNTMVRVSSEDMAALEQLPSLGSVCPLQSSFESVLSHSDAVASLQSGLRDEDVWKIADFYWGQGRHLHTSKQAASQLMQIDSANVEPLLGLLTNIMIHMDWGKKAALEELVAESGFECLCYCDLWRYDETPMKVSHKQAMDKTVPHQHQSHGSELEVASVALPSQSAAHLVTKATSVTKMFSSEHRFVMVLKVDAPNAEDVNCSNSNSYSVGV
eukprot:6460245-Amphidinium_carterae.1